MYQVASEAAEAYRHRNATVVAFVISSLFLFLLFAPPGDAITAIILCTRVVTASRDLACIARTLAALSARVSAG